MRNDERRRFAGRVKKKLDVFTRVMSAVDIPQRPSRLFAAAHAPSRKKRRVVIFATGTGNHHRFSRRAGRKSKPI